MAGKRKKLSASLEDYLEAIFLICRDNGIARSKEIAETLGVSRASVTGALRMLAQKKLIDYKPYSLIRLTPKGRQIAQKVLRRHNIIKSFFVNVLGVDGELAQTAACEAEHALGPQIVDRLLEFIEFVNEKNSHGHPVSEEFRRFYKMNHKRNHGNGAGKSD